MQNPIKISDRLPEIGQYALFMCDHYNSYMHVVRHITDQERWFYADTMEIATQFDIDNFTHWIPLDHKDKWD